MITAYAVYNGDTLVKAGHVSDFDLDKQAGAGETVFALPDGVLTYPDLTLEPLRGQLLVQIDTDAETTRSLYITPGSGQALVYQYKAAEARAWTADNAAATPFLSAEAAARGMTVAALAAEVLTQVADWTTAGSQIEAKRMGAKAALAAASTIPAMFTAATVDWALEG